VVPFVSSTRVLTVNDAQIPSGESSTSPIVLIR